MTATDLELLQHYTRESAEDAFSALVHRHLDLVYSAALRQVRQPQLAEDVAQSVFADLARFGARLKPGTVVSAWLYRVTRRTAIDVVRRESRRQARERTATELTAMNQQSSEWTQIEPLLDEAMEALGEADRCAILLRFFENKSLREVGLILRTSEDAAQKRVSRAVERLRRFLARRGVAVGASGVTAVVSAHAVHAAPAALAAAISSAAALTATAASTSTSIATTKAIAMTALHKTLAGAALLAAVGTAIYQTSQATRRREQVEALQQRQARTGAILERLKTERDAAANTLAALQRENEQLRLDAAELQRLRGEIARLRAAASDEAGRKSADGGPMKSEADYWAAKADALRHRLEEMPDKRIPELQLLQEPDWLLAAKTADLETDAGARRAFNSLRKRAKSEFAGMLQQALRRYADANGGQLPGDLLQLKVYFASPIDDAILERYALLRTGRLTDAPPGASLVAERAAPVDEYFDSHYEISANGAVIDEHNLPSDALLHPYMEFASANNGREPADPSELLPYVKTPEERAALQKLIQQAAADR